MIARSALRVADFVSHVNLAVWPFYSIESGVVANGRALRPWVRWYYQVPAHGGVQFECHGVPEMQALVGAVRLLSTLWSSRARTLLLRRGLLPWRA